MNESRIARPQSAREIHSCTQKFVSRSRNCLLIWNCKTTKCADVPWQLILARDLFIWVRDSFMCVHNSVAQSIRNLTVLEHERACSFIWVRDSIIWVRDSFIWIRDSFIWVRDSSVRTLPAKCGTIYMRARSHEFVTHLYEFVTHLHVMHPHIVSQLLACTVSAIQHIQSQHTRAHRNTLQHTTTHHANRRRFCARVGYRPL